MNKKFLSAILFGALMVTSTGTFVSCKDYDDDIDRIDKELSEVKETIASLDSAIKAGKFVPFLIVILEPSVKTSSYPPVTSLHD